MVYKTTLKKAGDMVGHQNDYIGTVVSESTTSVIDGTTLNLSDVELTDIAEVTPASPGIRYLISKRFVVLVNFFCRVLSWLNGSGSSEIDVHRMETHNDQHLGLRKWNL